MKKILFFFLISTATFAQNLAAPNDSKYDWMNNAIFVCKGVPSNGYVSIQVWKVL